MGTNRQHQSVSNEDLSIQEDMLSNHAAACVSCHREGLVMEK
jgi:hypothetical protein